MEFLKRKTKDKLYRRHLLFLVFVVTIVHIIFYVYLLDLKSKEAINNFKKLSAAEIAENDVFNLSTKLNYLSSDVSFGCIIFKLNVDKMYSSGCINSFSNLLERKLSVALNEKLSLDLSTKLSLLDSMFILISYVFQLIFILYLFFKLKTLQKENFDREIEYNKSLHLLELKKINETVEIAHQVAHDIKSPLNVLEFVFKKKNVNGVSGNSDAISAIKRIEEISNDLLEKYKIKNDIVTPGFLDSIPAIVGSVVNEKKIMLKENIVINFFDTSNFKADSKIKSSNLKRIISNIINNSIEAIKYNGTINVYLSNNENFYELKISDNGKGIPSDILPHLMIKGFSYGKENGNGLGLSFAREQLKSVGGDISIKSDLGSGTEIFLHIPTSYSPNVSIEDVSSNQFVLIEDTDLVHILWKKEATLKGVDLRCYRDFESFLNDKLSIDSKTRIYVDSDLGDGIRGEDIVVELNKLGFCNLFMTTGFPPEKFSHLTFLKGVIDKKPPF